MTSAADRAKAASPRSLSGLLPFLRPYRGRIAAAIVFLIGAAITTLAFPVALRWLIENPVVLPIPGAKNASQAQQNAGALGFSLSAAEVAELDRATAAWKR